MPFDPHAVPQPPFGPFNARKWLLRELGLPWPPADDEALRLLLKGCWAKGMTPIEDMATESGEFAIAAFDLQYEGICDDSFGERLRIISARRRGRDAGSPHCLCSFRGGCRCDCACGVGPGFPGPRCPA